MNLFLRDCFLIVMFYMIYYRYEIVLENIQWFSKYICWTCYQLFIYYTQLPFYPFIIINQFVVIIYLIFVIKKIRNENK